jgi:hypothetical protein
MIAELCQSYTRLDVPEHASHVSRAGDDLTVINESTATQITRVSTEFPRALDAVAFLYPEIVDGADVIKASAGDKVA